MYFTWHNTLQVHHCVVFQSLSCVRLCETKWTIAPQASQSSTISWSLLKLMSIVSMMASNHLIFCCPLLLLPSVFSTSGSFNPHQNPDSSLLITLIRWWWWWWWWWWWLFYDVTVLRGWEDEMSDAVEVSGEISGWLESSGRTLEGSTGFPLQLLRLWRRLNDANVRVYGGWRLGLFKLESQGFTIAGQLL